MIALRNQACALVLYASSALWSAFADGPQPDTPASQTPGARALAYARDHLGERVGNGSCAALVSAALQAADAVGPRASDDDQEIWGSRIEKRAETRPGDILHFREVVLGGRRRRVENGKSVSEIYRIKMSDHLAIVEHARDEGRALIVLHQNFGPDDANESAKQRVRRDTIRLGDLRSGTITVYRPIARDASAPGDDTRSRPPERPADRLP